MNLVEKKYNSNLNMNNFFRDIKLKKQYIKKLKNKVNLINSLIKEKDSKNLNFLLFKSNYNQQLKEDFLVTHIIDVTFSRSNTFVHVMDYSGNLKFSCSAGSVQYKGKGKKSRFVVLRDIYKTLITKLSFLKGQPIALHLKNVGFSKVSIIKLLKKKFFIKTVRIFNLYPHNGCRKKKMRRKKFKKRRNG